MSEERFWNSDEYASTAKFAVTDGAMTMRQAGCIFRLDPAPPKVEYINNYIVSAIREQDNKVNAILAKQSALERQV